MTDSDVKPAWRETDRCSAFTHAGGRCSHRSGLIAGLCVFHDPARKDALKAMRQRGQAAAVVAREATRRERLALLSQSANAGPRPDVGSTLESVTAYALWVIRAHATGELGRPDALCARSLIETCLRGIERRDLERRVKVLSAELARLQKARQAA